MSTLDSTNISFQQLPHIEQVAREYLSVGEFERRRRPLTILFGCTLCLILLGSGSSWPLHGIMREFMFLLGICMAAVGMLGRTWSNLFISGYKTRVLICSGPYSMCRNPLYFFSAIGMIGIGLCSETLAMPLMMCFFFAIYYPWVIRCEESRLAAAHQQEYEEYCRQVPAFWPQVTSYHEPETYIMMPRIMRKNIMDAFWFIALAAVVHVISDLHEAQLLPRLFVLW